MLVHSQMTQAMRRRSEQAGPRCRPTRIIHRLDTFTRYSPRPYDIVAALGAGGMGEVYRARDTNLNRDVAIKVLPTLFASDAERLARFTREAHTLASLNHPNIAQIHGFEESNGVRALVMELVEGEELSQRIARGPIPTEDALLIAKQIAEALEAAHDLAIIHRDLKPANIKLRPDGVVKVLDFGLAKAMESGPAASDLTHSPTMSMMATQAGVILGTAAYMSPEQAKGFQADRRSDVFSFGSVLYEMLTGRPPFKGDTVADVLASVLVREPDMDLLPRNLNPRVPELLRRCLEKNPKKRWQAIGDLRVEIEAVAARPWVAPASADIGNRAPPLWKRVIPVVAALIVVGALSSMATLYFRPSTTLPLTVTRFAITLGEDQQQITNANRQAVAISPDGTKIAYAANFRLYLRSMSEPDAWPIRGTEGIQNVAVSNPVFSPDGESIAFWSGADQTLKRIAVSGGAAVPICPASSPFGMTWANNDIVFTQPQGIMRVSARGGEPKRLVDATGEEVLNSPQMLPDGQTLLFTLSANTSSPDRWDQARIVAQSLGSGERKTLARGSDARYVPTGHLVYARGGVLFAVPFDLKRLEVTAGEVPIVEGVWRTSGTSSGSALFSVSDTGSLIYVPGPAAPFSANQILALINTQGLTDALKVPPALYEYPRVSPDGTRLAFGTSAGKEAVIATYDLSGASAVRRITFGGNNRFPIWSANGERVTFQSDRNGDPAVFWQPADGGAAEQLTTPERGTSHTPESWSPKGEVLLFSQAKGSVWSLWTFSLKDRKATPFSDVNASAIPTNAIFSPNGRWVAYQIGYPGVTEGTTYIQPFPPTGVKYQIAEGGRPLWTRDGTKLFFVPGPGRLMVVGIKEAPNLIVTNQVAVPRGFGTAAPTTPRTFDIMADGRIVGVVAAGQIRSPSPSQSQIQISVVLNWFQELTSKVPTK